MVLPQSRQAVLSALIYSNIFSSPLTKDELWRYVINLDHKKQFELSESDFDKTLQSLLNDKEIITDGTYFALAKHNQNISRRRNAEKILQEKLDLAGKYASILSRIPSVQFIGLSGSVAAKNVTEQDDIDFFIITEKRLLWTTRLMIYFVLRALGKNRKRLEKRTKNKVCINMLLDCRVLSLPTHSHNLYVAHEIAQVIPLFNRCTTYQDFIQANAWVYDFLPHTNPHNVTYETKSTFRLVNTLLVALEPIVKALQFQYMKPHRTIEKVSETLLAFHPEDHTDEVLQSFEKQIKTALLEARYTRGH